MHFSPKLARTVRRLLLAIAASATLLLVSLLALDWWGGRAWERAKSTQAAAGRDLNKLPPEGTLPPDRNLMCSPIVQRLLFKERHGESFEHPQLFVPSDSRAIAHWTEGRSLDLAAVYRELRKQRPALQEVADPGKGLLAAFQHDRELAALVRVAALERGDAQFARPDPIQGDSFQHTPIIAFMPDRYLASLLRLEACIALQQGRDRDAFENAVTLLRLVRGHGGSGQIFVTEALFQMVLMKEALWPVWEASRMHRWDKDQWALIGEELRRIDLAETFRSALWLEQLAVIQLMDSRRFADDEFLAKPAAPWKRQCLRLFYVKGLLDYNKTYALEYADVWFDVLEAVGTERYLAMREKAAQADRVLEQRSQLNPTRRLMMSSTPAYGRLVDTLLSAQSALALARVAALLETRRLMEGSYPAILEDLGGTAVESLPRDPVTGGLPHYRLLPDGEYALHMVGTDGRDDGGRQQLLTWGSRSQTGDVIWPLLKPCTDR